MLAPPAMLSTDRAPLQDAAVHVLLQRTSMIIKRTNWAMVCTTIGLIACGTKQQRVRTSYVALENVESTYGKLITTGNHPTPYQNGTGERIGVFLDVHREVWVLPLTFGAKGEVLVCAPPALRNAQVTDRYPAGESIIGTTNEPTGWRGGTGKLELVFRNADGSFRWREIAGRQITDGSSCQGMPRPSQMLEYYRLAPSADEK